MELISLTAILCSVIVGGVVFQSCSFSYIGQNFDNTSFIEEDYFIKWQFPLILNTRHIYTDGVLLVNYTVLPNSLSNITLKAPTSNRYTWSPTPYNITLQPGNYYSESFTLVQGVSGGGFLSYSAIVYEENSNATIRFGYNIINSGTKPGSLPIGIILLSFIIFSSMNKIKKRKKKIAVSK